MDADGNNPVKLTQPQLRWESEIYPSWSPYGTKIAFRCHLDIAVMDADGNNPVKLTDRRGSDPAWSPDGTKVACE